MGKRCARAARIRSADWLGGVAWVAVGLRVRVDLSIPGEQGRPWGLPLVNLLRLHRWFSFPKRLLKADHLFWEAPAPRGGRTAHLPGGEQCAYRAEVP